MKAARYLLGVGFVVLTLLVLAKNLHLAYITGAEFYAGAATRFILNLASETGICSVAFTNYKLTGK